MAGAGNGAGRISGGSLDCILSGGGAVTGTCSTAVNYGSNLTMTFTAAVSTQPNANWTGGCAATVVSRLERPVP